MNGPIELVQSIDRRWEHLTIANDFVFCKTMLNPDLCREVIEAILGQPIERVEYVHRQEVVDSLPGNKGIQLDVYVRDEAGTVYNVEMQAANTHELPQRTRYYQSLMALDQISKGQRYTQLKDSIIIFICCFDPFGKGLRVYSFENRCREDFSIQLDDGASTIFLSADPTLPEKGTGQIDELLDYVSSGKVSGELSAKLASEVSRVLDNQKWRLEYMLLEVRDQLNFDKGVEEGRLLGEEIGLRRGRAEGEAAGLERGRAEGEAAGLERGRAEGEAAGLAQGEALFSRLVTTLAQLGRTDEAVLAASDAVLRERLYSELGIR